MFVVELEDIVDINAPKVGWEHLFWWNGMKRDSIDFVQPCLHCKISRTGKIVLPTLSTELHEKRPKWCSSLIHYVYVRAFDKRAGLLVADEDDLSGYTWMCFPEDPYCIIISERVIVSAPMERCSAYARKFWEQVRCHSLNGCSLLGNGHRW